MTPEQSAALRAPFDASTVGKLPKLSCRNCSEAPGKVCDTHRKEKCRECGNYMSTAHVHLDYVGHAAVTDRLLKVDPAWTWEPLALDAQGLPLLVSDRTVTLPDEKVALWIKLTVCGVTRLGFGGGKNLKEAIGDALRNAAMRFGVALDLWSKEDLQAEAEHEPAPRQPPAPRNGSTPPAAKPANGTAHSAADELARLKAAFVRDLAAVKSDEDLHALQPTFMSFPTEIKKQLKPLIDAQKQKVAELTGECPNPAGV